MGPGRGRRSSSYLASHDADYMTGQAPIIDGGIVVV